MAAHSLRRSVKAMRDLLDRDVIAVQLCEPSASQAVTAMKGILGLSSVSVFRRIISGSLRLSSSGVRNASRTTYVFPKAWCVVSRTSNRPFGWR